MQRKKENGLTEYFVTNGMFAGRWTIHFGVHCIADSYDCKSIMEAYKKENYEIKKLTVEIDLPYYPMGWIRE